MGKDTHAISRPLQAIGSPSLAGRAPGGAIAATVLGCFFISGVAGLIYQTVWVRMIDKVIGSAPFAVAAVLSVFMGGLALGSFAAGRIIDRRPERSTLLALYGKIEIAIGAYALLLPPAIAALKPLYQLAYAHLWPHPFLYTLFTFGGCLLLLIVPTTLMGATLPVLCRYYVSRLDTLGARTGRLYSLNTIGAAVGALLCGFVLIPGLGLPGTIAVAFSTNMAVGLCCLLLARRGRIGCIQPSEPPPGSLQHQSADHLSADRASGGAQRWALTLFAASGFCAMACEVFWTRLIGLIIGPTIYAFTVVVATFITGLAAGSLLFGWLADRIDKDLPLLGITQLGAALLSLVVSQWLGDSQFFFAKVIYTHQDDFSRLLLCQSLLLFAVLLGPTLFWGAAFPLVNRICARRLASLGRAIGNAYALNTVGAIVGAFAAGYVLIPLAGNELGLRMTAGVQWGLAALMLVHSTLSTRGSGIWRRAFAVLLLAGLLPLMQWPAWQPGLLSRGWYRDLAVLQDELARTGWWDALRHGKTVLANSRRGQQVLFQGEGVGGFTTVEQETTSLGTVEYAMFNSGKADASSHGDRSTQVLSGHLPLLFHPGARSVMVLGLASGMTAGEVLHYPVDLMDILEINEQVVAACRRFFGPFNGDCLDDPRTRLIIQDGRNHLFLTDNRYDVIISEPSNPWMAGLANLYTLEFFRLVKAHLGERGVFAQWIQSYEMDWDTFCLLGRTFATVFDKGALLKVGTGDYLLIGFAEGGGLDWDTARKNLTYAQRSDHMVLREIASLAHLVVTEDLPRLFGPGPLHTDLRPRLEFAAPRRLYAGGLDPEIAAADRRRLAPATRALLENHDGADDRLNLVELGASLYLPLFARLDPSGFTADQQARYLEIVRKYCTCSLVPAYGVFGDAGAKQVCAELQSQQIQQHISRNGTRNGDRPADHYNLGLALNAASRPEEARKAFESTVALAPDHAEAHIALGMLAAGAGRFDDAESHLRRAIELAPPRADAHKYLGMVATAAGNPEEAIGHLSSALRLAPDDVDGYNQLGVAQLRLGRVIEARDAFSTALRIDAGNAEAHHNLGLLFFSQGDTDQALAHFKTALQLDPGNPNTRHNLQAVITLAEQKRRGTPEPEKR